jgi:membrane fusion protein, copper/silver efflux system
VQAIAIGARYGDRIEIREGLDEGDRVVVSGQFLLDAESDLRSGLARLSSVPPSTHDDAHGEEAHRHD